MDWKDFPWGALLTLTSMLSAAVLALLNNHFSEKFVSKESINLLGNSLRSKIAEQRQTLEQLRTECQTAGRHAEEAFRHSQLVDRMLTEQWERISEELIKPIRDMSKEFQATRELLVRYTQAQDSQSKDIERLEKEGERRDSEIANLRAGRG